MLFSFFDKESYVKISNLVIQSKTIKKSMLFRFFEKESFIKIFLKCCRSHVPNRKYLTLNNDELGMTN